MKNMLPQKILLKKGLLMFLDIKGTETSDLW